ncbi:uncharacterized protein KY384_004506 [Bacidia gigantensis]|uniref:uncharacterized protein n=1 Tax=Bacidia gigantensis TaxID=2732470 RepID=UPI001D036ABE|nr:uncharacterized protein KY384_004506 [Bacidia gigantensis]KAG8531148.1 hypothetical protein KY384_004506 [Bacidia gigantensis]
MAEWKTRGYVPDSDEEEDSQESGQVTVCGDHFSLDELVTSDAREGSPSRNNGHKSSRLKDQLLKARQSPTSHIKAVEVRVPVQEVNQNSIQEYAEASWQGKPSSKIGASTNNVSEQVLQEGIYKDAHKARTMSKTSPLGRRDGDVEHALLSSPASSLNVSNGIEMQDAVQRQYLDAKTTGDGGNVEHHIGTTASAYPFDEHQSLSSTLSSPLSSHPSSLPGVKDTISHTRPSSPSSENVHAESSVQADSSDVDMNTVVHDVQRTQRFRQRNPIQLHPYLIESEKYRQSLHARGLKPVHIPRAPTPSLEDDTQSQDFANSPVLGFSSPSSQKSQPSSPMALDENQSALLDEVPDMDALLRSQNQQLEVQSYKRRDMERDKPRFKRPPGLSKPKPLKTKPIHQHSNEDYDMYTVPLSPPSSGFHTPTTLGERAKRQSPPNKSLPTPATSSEPRAPPLIDIINQESAEDNADEIIAISDGTGASSPISNDGSVKQLSRVQRRIRGVLPASWLKLDLKAQSKKSALPRRLPSSSSPEKRDKQKGVARPVSRTVAETFNRSLDQYEAFLSSDNQQSSDNGDQPNFLASRLSPIMQVDDEADDFLGRLGEADEIDEIDAMLSIHRRKASHQTKGRKRQTRMSDFGVECSLNVARVSKRPRLTAPSTKQPSLMAHRDRVSKPKFRVPRLSILDAPPNATAINPPPPPAFLKIASRTVRSRHDRGRHSPGRKFLRLATTDDNHDVNESLQAWRDGAIRPSVSQKDDRRSILHFRQPLQPRSGNSILPSSLKLPLGSASKTARSASPQDYAPKRPTARKVQTVLKSNVRTPVTDDPENSQQPTKNISGGPNVPNLKKKNLKSTLKTTHGSRPAMLESLEDGENQIRPGFSLSHHLLRLNQSDPLHLISRPQRDAIVEDVNLPPASIESREGKSLPLKHSPQVEKRQPNPVKRNGRRKRRPQRLEISATSQAQLSPQLPVDDLPMIAKEQDFSRDKATKHEGLTPLQFGPFSTRFTSTFDIVPFPPGTSFHQSTFLGSGDFQTSMQLSKIDLDSHRSFANFMFNHVNFKWGPWNEQLSVQLTQICDLLHQASQAQPIEEYLSQLAEFLVYLIGYFSNHVSFLDPIDRASCLQRCNAVIKLISPATSPVLVGSFRMQENRITDNDPQLLRVQMLSFIFANQLRQLSQHSDVSSSIWQETTFLFSTVGKQLGELIHTNLESLEKLVNKFKRYSDSDLTICNNSTAEALIVARHILQHDGRLHDDFWDTLIRSGPNASSDATVRAEILEQTWKALYTLLPFSEFDTQGVLTSGSRFSSNVGNWNAVKRLISPVLDNYMTVKEGQSPNFNFYCRALFSRCLHLINVWGWRKCDSIIGTLFDFFARNQLNHLNHEQSHGSPHFLEVLGTTVSLESGPEDRCFHLLLKIIGNGIKFMRKTFPEKKIKDLVWRLMPNHGRSHLKEEALRLNDLDALRNHHDLLCTLYWVSPPSVRPRLTAIRNLVHIESSHKEVVQLNLRAWAYLVNFQLKTDEPMSNLEPFVEWHNDLLQQILRQHSLARTEAEEHARAVQHVQNTVVSPHLLESTIATNQRQVEASLGDALTSLRRAIQSAKTNDAADLLLSPYVTAVFKIFNAAQSHTNSPILDALDILITYIRRILDPNRPETVAPENEDSQQYGDWAVFSDDFDEIDDETINVPMPEFHDQLRQLLSNCFGADLLPTENVLARVLEAWAALNQMLVRSSHRSWADYVGSYGNDAWSTLRDTQQTRKYTSYYLALLIEEDSSIFEDQKAALLQFFMQALVERESLLKFQHRFTCALLNANSNDVLLSNPPFWRNRDSNRFEISLPEFSERRLSLISSILSNMRTSTDNAQLKQSTNTPQLKSEYRELLRYLMATMKQNYQDLGQSANVKGAYVGFVQNVVELLQQHSSSICSVDSFFTNNASFPLPASDPTYIVGQLRNYGLRLADSRTPKELVAFVQSISERAAMDGQQAYLINQLHNATSGTFGDILQRSSLRDFVIQTIFPAYARMASESMCGWILVLPVLHTLVKTFDDLEKDLDGYNVNSVAAVANLVTSYLYTMRIAAFQTVKQQRLLGQPGVLKTIRTSFHAMNALLPTLDYLYRLRGPVKQAMSEIEMLRTLGVHLADKSMGHEVMISALPQCIEAEERIFVSSDICEFATGELRQTLEKNWICVDGNYFLIRGKFRKEVLVDVGLLEEEQSELRRTIENVEATIDGFPSWADPNLETRCEIRMVDGLTDLMI